MKSTFGMVGNRKLEAEITWTNEVLFAATFLEKRSFDM